MASPRFDRLLRALLGAPGWVLDRLDGRVPRIASEAPTKIYPLVCRTARHPESRLALEDGLTYARSAHGVLAYKVRGRTAFGVGGLNVAPSHRRALIRTWLARCEGQGLTRQLVFPARPEELADLGGLGFASVQVGVESRLDLAGWSLAGGARADLRQMVNRARRRGVWVEEVRPEAYREALEALHGRWLASRRPSWPMGLLVGSPSLHAPFDRRYVVARTEGRLEAFCTLLPSTGGVWGLDVMVRQPDAVPGSMETLLATAASRLQEEGAAVLSLGANPMAGIPAGGPRPMLHAIFRGLYGTPLGNQVFGFRTLHHFKRKFAPDERPVYLASRPRHGVVALYRGCRMWGLY